MVTSYKGGVGKTTISANLAMSLARRGHKVVAIDCDLESRCLDIVLGLENATLFNICDVLKGTCSIDNAIVKDPRCENFSFICAPAFYPERYEIGEVAEKFTKEAVGDLIKTLSERFEYIFFDLPARPDKLYKFLALFCDTALVISQHTAASIRAAEKTAISLMELCGYGKDNLTSGGLDIKLIVNGFRAKDAKTGLNAGLFDIISRTKLSLAGVIPFDSAMSRAQEMGKLSHEVKGGKKQFYHAIQNIASRCEGRKVSLFENVDIGLKDTKVTY